MGEKTLAEQLGIDEEDAHVFVAKFHQRFPGIRQFVKKTLSEVRESGFVTTLDGRRRRLPSLQSSSSVLEKSKREIVLVGPFKD